MYLPRNLPLCRPHVAMWTGASGKRYDFAVCRPGTIGVDEPAVFILARHDGQLTTPLFVGHTTSLHRRFGLSGGRCPEQWRRALAIGMTHVHLRFDTFSKSTREAEVRDLVAALRPVLNDQPDEERSLPALESAELEAPRSDRTRLYRHDRWGAVSEARSPALATIGIDRQSFAERAVASPLFRADPAREEDGEPGDFDTSAVDAPPDAESPTDVRDDDKPFGEFEQEAEVLQLTPAVPGASPDVLHEPDEQVTPSPLPGDADGVQATASAEPARLTSFLVRVRELVARLRAPWRPDAVEDAGSAEPRSGPAAAPAVIIAPLTAAGAAALAAGNGETCGGVWMDATPVPHETTRASEDKSPAEPSAAEAPEDAEPVETPSAGPVEVSEDASAREPISAEASENASSVEPVEVSEHAAGLGPIAAEAPEDATSAEPVEVSKHASLPDPIMEASNDTSPPEAIAAEAGVNGQKEAKRVLDLDPFAPVVLFAGNLSYEAGADILFDAIVTVCGGNHEAQFLFAGDGALKGDLQAWASRAGLDRRCRFLGHVPAESFDRVLAACDFVVIPARVPQDDALARAAILAGKPVVTTHQAAIPSIVHGRNGLITYDNPGSLVWAIRALLSPLRASLRRNLAETA